MNLAPITGFVRGAFSGGPPEAPTPSASRTLMGTVVTAALIWLTVELILHGMSSNWVASFGILMGGVSGGYAIGKFADKPTLPPSPPRTTGP